MDNVRPVTKQSDEFPHQNHYPDARPSDYNQPATRTGEPAQGQGPMTLDDIRNWRPATREGEVRPIPIPKPMTLEDIRSFRPVTRDNDQSQPQHKPDKKGPSYLELPDIYGKGG